MKALRCTVSYDETHSIWFSQREHGDVELLRSTVGSMDVKTALQIINQTQLFIALSSRCAGPSFQIALYSTCEHKH